MGMAAMLIMNVTLGMIVPVVIVTMLMAVMRYMGVRMQMPVVVMVVSMTDMIVGGRCSQRHRR